jgi:hypothetical protein
VVQKKMLELKYEMTFAERIEGPLGPTTGSPPRLCWQVPEATLAGRRQIEYELYQVA